MADRPRGAGRPSDVAEAQEDAGAAVHETIAWQLGKAGR